MGRRRGVAIGAAILTILGGAIVWMASGAYSNPDDLRNHPDHPSKQRVVVAGARTVEGEIVGKKVRKLRDNPDIEYSSDPEVAASQHSVTDFNRYIAEFDVKVDTWLDGDGPSRITIVRGVAFEDLAGVGAVASTDWRSRDSFDALAVGGRYRFSVETDPFLKKHYFLLLSVESL